MIIEEMLPKFIKTQLSAGDYALLLDAVYRISAEKYSEGWREGYDDAKMEETI